MRSLLLLLLATALLLVIGGCAKDEGRLPGAALQGEAVRPGSALAYEHSLDIVLAGELIVERMDALREHCAADRFGSCSMLRYEHRGGDRPSGSLVLRVAPAAVESLVAVAGEGGQISTRDTRAEDLAQAVADTSRLREQAELQRQRLLAFQARTDLSVSDMLTIARELAQVEAQLAEAERAAANQQRRIETNLLTIRFSTDHEASRLTRIGDAVTDALDSALDGSAEAIEMLAFGLPFLLLAFPLALLWRWSWRRLTRRSGGGLADKSRG